MKRRTRATAWIIIIWGLAGAMKMLSSPVASRADRVYLMVCGLAVITMWIFVLMKKQWARNALILLLVIQYAGMIHNAYGFPWAHGRFAVVGWVCFGFMSITFIGWQMFVLLTENPSNWNVGAPESIKR